MDNAKGLIYSKISVRFEAAESPPYFIGSQIRGALGYALKAVVCINPAMRCEGCFAATECLYARWFERKEGYTRYRLDFELGRSYYDFSLYLFGDATQKLPYVVSAIHRMLTKTGLGKTRYKPKEFTLALNDEVLPTVPGIVLPQETTLRWEAPQEYRSEVILRSVTPFRIKQENRFVRNPSRLKLPTLLNSIYQRERVLLGKERSRPPRPFIGEIAEAIGSFKDLSRYSGRQKSRLKIGGLDARLKIEGIGLEEYRLLRLAELIGVGKQTAFGLGKVEILDKI